jgi:FkbM family methyltransferase
MKRVGSFWFPDGETQMLEEVERTGSWQLGRLHAALRHLDPHRRRTALDVGAHVGTWARELARHFQRVVAFEPVPETYECLCGNVTAREGCRVELHNLAVADRTATWAFFPDDRWGPGNTGGTFLLPEGGGEEIPIRSVLLDSMDFTGLDFVKIDVEGMEAQVLEGGARTLARHRPLIVWENKPRFANRNPHSRTSEEVLGSLGARRLARQGADEIWGWS